MGILVVVSKQSDYPEVQEYKSGILVNLDFKEISRAFEELLLDEDKLKIFSNNTKKLIKENFLVEDQIKKFEQLYYSLIH